MKLSAGTILGIAMEVERRGIEFYTRVRDRLGVELADQLAEEERKHIRTFQELFAKAGSDAPAVSFDNAHLDDDYLVAAYGGTGVFALVDPAAVGIEALFDIAIAMEKNSVMLYSDLLIAIGRTDSREARLLAGIQDEERAHLRSLVLRKRALKG